ncbi:MAG: hypothetical protein IJ110_07060 [Lachnospiraceae bacterium]|nr:hypothetical protein [Lachnospiraceae bacterium]
MKKISIAAAGLATILTTSVLFAYAEPSGKIIPAQDDAVHYCRTHLSEEEQLLYDALLACALSEDPTAKGGEFQISHDPAGDEFKTMFHTCYNALLFDHPELFWLSVSSSSFRYSYRRLIMNEGGYSVSIQLSDSFPDKDEQMKALDSAAEEFLADIDLADSAPNVALAIHDKLIDLVSYDKEAASSLDKDLAHTAYGALVANSRGDANSAVCDGYSYAYEYLLQKAGIRSTIIAGRAGDTEESAGPHSWNLVELSGEWYEVDSTWNDISAEEALNSEEEYSEIAEEAMRNEWYTDRLRHFLFNVTTEQISSFEPGKYYRYTNDRGWVSFLSDSVHIRHTQEDSSSTGDYMTPLAPTAEGTQFSYENLKDGNQDGE